MDRALGGELAVDDVDLRDLHRHAGVQPRGEAGADLEAEQAAAEQRVAVAAVVHDLRHDVDDRLREPLGRVLAAEDLRRAVVAERRGEVVGGVADDDGVRLGAELGRQARGLGDRAERVLVERALVVQGEDEDVRAHDSSFLSSSQATIFSTVSFVSSSSMIVPPDFAGGALKSPQTTFEPASPTRSASMLGVADAERLERLLLRAHDRLQRRVARLVDRVADGDDGGQLDVDGVVAVLGLALAAQRALGDVHLDDLRQRRHLQVVGDDGADRVALAVVGLLAEQDEVGALALEHLGERVAGRGDVGAGERVVGEVDGAVGAERDGLVQRAHGGARAHRHGDDLVDLDDAALLDLHRGLDRVRVVGVEVALAAAVHPAGLRVDPLLDGGVGHLLHQDADLHEGSPSWDGACGAG